MISSTILEGLTCHDTGQLYAKLSALKEAGTAKLQLIFDFDRTLTVGRAGVNGDITVWNILKEHLPPVGRDRYQKYFDHYRALELSGNMTHKEAAEWWSLILDLYVEYRINIREVEHDFLSKATIRPGAKELFEFCYQYEIPTIILSAGIREVIEIWARTYGIRPTIIHATSLQLNAKRDIVGWNKNTLVHVMNKKEQGNSHDEISRVRKERTKVMLVGDGLGDADMAEGEADVMRLLIHDPRPDEEPHQLSARREKSLSIFDAIIETGSLRPMLVLVREVAG